MMSEKLRQEIELWITNEKQKEKIIKYHRKKDLFRYSQIKEAIKILLYGDKRIKYQFGYKETTIHTIFCQRSIPEIKAIEILEYLHKKDYMIKYDDRKTDRYNIIQIRNYYGINKFLINALTTDYINSGWGYSICNGNDKKFMYNTKNIELVSKSCYTYQLNFNKFDSLLCDNRMKHVILCDSML